MKRNVIKAFSATFLLLAAALTVPFLKGTAIASAPATTGSARAADRCKSDSNPFKAVICISAEGDACPDTIHVHQRQGNNPVKIKFTGPADSKLSIALDPVTCKAIKGVTCTGNNCDGETNEKLVIKTETTPPCHYQATVTASGKSVTGPDPYIVTDSCCPGPVGGKKPGKKKP